MGRKLLFSGVGVGATLLASYILYLLFASEETRIRWLLSDMQDAFNNGYALRFSGGLAEEVRIDAERRGSATLGRRELAGYLYRVFGENRGADDEFLVRAEILSLHEINAEAPLGIQVDREVDPRRARLECLVILFRKSRAPPQKNIDPDRSMSEREVARIRIAARLVVEERKWRLATVNLNVVEGKIPF